MAELDPARWEEVTRLFELAVALPSGSRLDWLSEATADPAIREAVEELLAADERAAPVLDASLGALATAAGGTEPGTDLIGERIGPWRILRELGRGGMGAVYLAERADGSYDKRVALKIVKRGMDTDEILRRFRRERQILASLEHPNIARLHDGGVTPDGRPYLVMELVEGERIDRYADAHALDARARIVLVAKVCRAVDHAHQHRIVHRDIKPSNILVTADGDVRLLDFGIARLLDDEGDAAAVRTGTGRQFLTPAYASPEQVAGHAVTPASDVFALGIVLHELVTGDRVPDPLTPTPAGAGIAPSTPRRRLRGDLGTIVLKSTDRRPMARYDSARALADDLERHLAGAPIAARPAGPGSRIRAALPRHAPWLGAAATLLGLVLVATRHPKTARATDPAVLARPTTLAVVPMASQPGDSGDAYLVHGIGDELAIRLGRLRRLRVKSPRAVAAELSAGSSPRALGERLGVSYLLEAGVHRRDSTIEVAVSLVEVANGFQVWADDYSTTSAGLLALQDSVVRDVAAAVTGELGADERALLARRPSSSAAAYDHFLRGNYLLSRRTPASTRDAAHEFELAVVLDGRFAEAMARAAYAYLLQLDWGWRHPDHTPAALLQSAASLADRAIEIDPGSATVWITQAYLRALRDPVRLDGAAAAFERALRIDSLDAEAHYQYGQTLMVLGRDDEAIAAYQRALALEPARPTMLVSLGSIHSIRGDQAAAARYLDSAHALAATARAPYALAVWGGFRLRMGAAHAREAEDAARLALATDSSYSAPALAVLAMAQVAGGDSNAARITMRALLSGIDTSSPGPTDARFAAPALVALGREDAALTLLERARPRGAQLWFYMRSRDFETLRRHPRFQKLFDEVDPRPNAPPS